MQSVTLYMEAFWRNPGDCSVFVALREKGVPFERSMGMFREGVGAVAALHARTITGTAPVLQHGGFWLAEALAIIEYLEEVFPPPQWPRLLPAELQPRTRARQLMAWLRTNLASLRRERSTDCMFFPLRDPMPPLTPEAARGAHRLLQIAEQLGAGPSGTLFGDQFSIADSDLAFDLMRLVAANDPVPERLAAYARAVWTRPSVREFVEHPRPPNVP